MRSFMCVDIGLAASSFMAFTSGWLGKTLKLSIGVSTPLEDLETGLPCGGSVSAREGNIQNIKVESGFLRVGFIGSTRVSKGRACDRGAGK